MELKQYVTFLQRWWLLIVLCAGVLGIFGYVFGQEAPKYVSSTTLMVNSSRAGATRALPNFDTIRTSAALAQTYAELLTTRPVMQRVIETLELEMSPEALRSRIDVTSLNDTDLLLLEVTDTNRQQSAAIANEVVEVFNAQAGDLLSNPYAFVIETVRVIELAQPGKQLPSEAPRSGILAAVVGALLAAAIGFLRDFFDDRVRSSAVIESLAGLPTLAEIPNIKGEPGAGKLVTALDMQSPIAESYRMVRAHLDAAEINQPIRAIVVTSAEPLEGKSTTTANLAVALAQTGKRVVVVDADLRRPTLHTIFQRTNTRGLVTALQRSSNESIADHLAPGGVENLHLMSSGPSTSNPTELLGTQRLSMLIEELKTQADLILFDSPALLHVVDPMLLMRACDAALLVAHANTTRIDALIKSRDQIVQSGTRLLGVVLNQATLFRSKQTAYYGGILSAQKQPQMQKSQGLQQPFAQNGSNGGSPSLGASDVPESARTISE
ncbi:MAG: polysaccharide biosynthesis tyrosine autokinase [Chloroflexales bacterium]|nr:polysaccharide biosynthesis tyrosine autokinase [Chloroflexales bacterium]